MNRFMANVDHNSVDQNSVDQDPVDQNPADPLQTLAIDRPLVLVGMMGAGKTSVGRRLAEVLRLPFRDADDEIEKAAGLTVSEIFERHGEAEFRRGERRVIKRLLEGPPHVLATGGGAFMDPDTRALIKQKAVSVWLKADLDVLMRRVLRRPTRPLLQVEDPRAAMTTLLAKREPIYAEADIMVQSNQGPHGAAVQAVLARIAPFYPKASA
jgi:shikimate kinase